MILRIAALAAVLSLFRCAAAEVAPEITTVAEGYNVIAKIPCVGCAFLYQDTSKGKDVPWTQRKDENAFLLNISLPYDAAHLSINNAALLSSSAILPKVHASQVLLDTSQADLFNLIATNQLDTPGGASFGVSYAYSLRPVKSSRAFLFRFDIMELWTDLLTPPLTIVLDDAQQKVLELVLLERPLLSAGDPGNAFEIVRAELVVRDGNEPRRGRRTMWFQDWDAHGKKGTTAHLVNSASDSFVAYVTSGVWTLILFITGVIFVFFGLCLLVIFGCGLHKDEYERAQHGKRTGGAGRGSGSWGGNDVEKARRFKTPEELGLRNSGRVVGVGKSD